MVVIAGSPARWIASPASFIRMGIETFKLNKHLFKAKK
jgi:hypothetical protein